MNCPICNSKTKVINSRLIKNRIRRRRECTDCFTRFNTYEELEYNSLPAYVRYRLENGGVRDE